MTTRLLDNRLNCHLGWKFFFDLLMMVCWRHQLCEIFTRFLPKWYIIHVMLIFLEKVWIQLFILWRWVNSRIDYAIKPWYGYRSRRRKTLNLNQLFTWRGIMSAQDTLCEYCPLRLNHYILCIEFVANLKRMSPNSLIFQTSVGISSKPAAFLFTFF